ncbi:MAG: hypothetical protein JW768_00240 [Chitinispirillaceae bacterium]|nr:hypothetical protein [Chitinispirillaceae bacterium]
MPEPYNENNPETPLSVKLLDGYIEQVDRVGPELVKAANDYRHACTSALGFVRKNVLGAIERTGHKPVFMNTAADIVENSFSTLVALQCTLVESTINAHRTTATMIRDTLSGKASS